MPIYKRGNKYQVKLRGSDGQWITKTLPTFHEAQKVEAELKHSLLSGAVITRLSQKITLDTFSEHWFESIQSDASPGWHKNRLQMFRDYVRPQLGKTQLERITPAHISKIFSEIYKAGKSPQTARHVYSLLKKLFSSAVEDFQLIGKNPVSRKFKPRLPQKERDHLTYQEASTLLGHIEGKPYEIAILLGLLAGMRAGEIQALRWSNVDLEKGVIHIREAFARKDGQFKNYPKGKRWLKIPILPDLKQKLEQAKITTTSEFVATAPSRRKNPYVCYNGVSRALKQYCNEAGIKAITPHELRHTMGIIFSEFGGTKENLRAMLGHSDINVTNRYWHAKEETDLTRLATAVKMPKRPPTVKSVPKMFPNEDTEPVDSRKDVC